MGYTYYWKMGYTHYWKLASISQHSSRFSAAARDMARLVNAAPCRLGDGMGEGSPILEEREVVFNGFGAEHYETFAFPGAPHDFCKTEEKPYDLIVVACLAVAKDIFGDEIHVSSDGDTSDWVAGVEFASRVLGRDIANPIPRG